MADNKNLDKGCPCPPFPPHPPKPPKPPVPPVPPEPIEIKSKDIILTKKLHNVLYELIVKTRANMVYTDETDTETLTERLAKIAEDLLSLAERSDTFDNKFAELMKDAPETFRTFKEVWDYVNVNGDPESELIRMIKSKQDAEEGKGLSTHDLTDVLYEKLVNGYSAEELNEKFAIIARDTKNLAIDIKETKEELKEDIQDLSKQTESTINSLTEKVSEKFEEVEKKIDEVDEKPNIITSEEVPEDIPDYTCWYKVVSWDAE